MGGSGARALLRLFLWKARAPAHAAALADTAGAGLAEGSCVCRPPRPLRLPAGGQHLVADRQWRPSGVTVTPGPQAATALAVHRGALSGVPAGSIGAQCHGGPATSLAVLTECAQSRADGLAVSVRLRARGNGRGAPRSDQHHDGRPITHQRVRARTHWQGPSSLACAPQWQPAAWLFDFAEVARCASRLRCQWSRCPVLCAQLNTGVAPRLVISAVGHLVRTT
jgi:hypothetical protein